MDTSTGLPVVGVISPDELGWLTRQAAFTLGQKLRVFEDRVFEDRVRGGSARSARDRLGDFAQACDVVTPGSRDAPLRLLTELADLGVAVRPSPDALRRVRNDGPASGDGPAAADSTRGSRTVAIVARSPFGQVAAYPAVRTTWCGTVRLQIMTAAADDVTATAAQQRAIELAVGAGLVGLLTVEFTGRADGVRAGSMAMWPSPVGNWTVDGARTSQYEQLLRALVDYPLGETTPAAPVVVTASIPAQRRPPAMSLDERLHHCFAADPGARVHLYGGGEPRADSPAGTPTIGHVTVLGEDVEDARSRVLRAVRWMEVGHR